MNLCISLCDVNISTERNRASCPTAQEDSGRSVTRNTHEVQQIINLVKTLVCVLLPITFLEFIFLHI